MQMDNRDTLKMPASLIIAFFLLVVPAAHTQVVYGQDVLARVAATGEWNKRLEAQFRDGIFCAAASSRNT